MEREGEKLSSGGSEEFCSNGDDKKICSNCKKEVDTANFDLHFAHCTRYQIVCQLCNEPVHVNDATDHMEVKHARVTCEDCSSIMDRWELDGPHKESCQKRSVICQYCDIRLPFDSLQEHVSFCGSRTDPCPMCKKFVLKKEKENHIKEECTKRLILCTYCQTTYPFDERIAHVKLCVVNSEQDLQGNEARKTIGSYSKKLIKDITSSQEYEMAYKCVICAKVVPANEFRSHYEACIENARSSNKFPVYNETVNKIDEHILPSYVKTEGSSDDFACDDNQATKHKSSSDQLQATKSDNGCRPKKPHGKVITSSLGDAIPYINDRQEENVVFIKCSLCKANVPQNEFRKHYEACIENSQSSNQFPRYSKKMDKSNEYVPSSVKTEKSSSGPTSFANNNQAARLKPSSDQLQATKNHEFLCENPSSADKHDGESIICEHCKSRYAVHEFKEHLKQCVRKKFTLCVCGDYVLHQELPEHQEKCTGTLFMMPCGLCHAKYTISEYQNHRKSCPMSVTTCEFCNETFLRHEQENHPCTQDTRKNKVKSKSHRFQHTSDLTVMHQAENKESENDKTECCQYCKRKFPVNQLKQHIKACFMSPLKCYHCGETFPFDESEYHKRLCPVLSERNKLKSEGHKLDPSDATNSMEDGKVFSGFSKYRQNDQVVQSPGSFAESKRLMEDDTEYSQYQEKHGTKDDRWPKGHFQMSAQNQKSAFEPELGVKVMFCRFCMRQFDTRELEKHMIQCDEHCTECAICGASVKFKELESHTKLHTEVEECQFCKGYYLSYEEHFLSCPMARMTREKNFPPGKFETDSYSARASTKDRKEGSNQNLMHGNNRKHFQQNAETNESSDYPMEVDEQSVEVQNIPEGNQTEAFSSRTREVSSRTSGDGVIDDLRRPRKLLFKCKLCDQEMSVDDLFMSVFNGKEISLCVNCVKEIRDHKTDFAGNIYSNASSPPDSECDPQSADTVEQKKGYELEVKACEYCDRHVPLDVLNEHIEKCESRIYECPKCKTPMLLGDREAHGFICDGKKLDCPDSEDSAQKKKGANGSQGEKRACQFCGEVPKVAIKAHEKHCGVRRTKCEKCKKCVRLCDMKNHWENQHRKELGSFCPPGYARRTSDSVEEKENTTNEKIQATHGTGLKKCDLCDKLLSYAEVSDHEKSCVMRPDTCNYCHTVLPHCIKRQHVEEDCPGVSFQHGTGRGQSLKGGAKNEKPQQKEANRRGNPGQEQKSFIDKIGSRLWPGSSPQRASDNTLAGHNRNSSSTPGYKNTYSNESIKIPCEFCDTLCTVEELIVHQSGCRSDLFTGSSEPDAGESITPQDRRRDDDRAPVNRNSSVQGNANLREEDRNKESQGMKRFALFDKHPLDDGDDEELNDVRVSHQNRRSGNRNFAEIGMERGRRNVSNINITGNGGEQPVNSCQECQHLNRPEHPQSYTGSQHVNLHPRLKAGPRNEDFYEVETKNKHDFQTKVENNHYDIDEKPSHSMSDKDCVPPRQNTDSGAFTFVAKVDKRNVGSGSLNELSGSEQDQQRYHQERRLGQNAERSCDDQHSKNYYDDRKGRVQFKITYREDRRSSTNEDGNNSEMYSRHDSDPHLHREMKQLPTRKIFRNDKDSTGELSNYENEISVKRAGYLTGAEQFDENYKYRHCETDPLGDLTPQLAKLSLDHYGGRSCSSGESENQRSHQWNRSAENSGIVSDKSSNPRSAPRQSEFNMSHTRSRGSDKQEENFPPTSGKYPEKLVPECQNDKKPMNHNDQRRFRDGDYHGYKAQEAWGSNNSVKGGRNNCKANNKKAQQDYTGKKTYNGNKWK